MTTAVSILFELARAGITVTLDGANLRILPVSSLTPTHRTLIVDNKSAIVGLLSSAQQTTRELLHAIDATCDARGDDDRNRAGLKSECRVLLPHEQADMRDHFKGEAKRWAAPKGDG